MVELLLWKEKIRRLYSRYDLYIVAVGKFFLALASFLTVIRQTGYYTELNNPFLLVALSLVCSFFSASWITVFLCILIVIEFCSVSIQLAALAIIFFFIAFLLYFEMKPENSYLTALAVILCSLRISGSTAIVLGLAIGPLAGIPVVFGIIITYLIQNINTNFNILAGQTSIMTAAQKFIFGIDVLIKEQSMWIEIAIIMSVIFIVYLIRHMSIDYSWSIATVSGVIVFAVIGMISNTVLNIKLDLLIMLSNITLAVLAALIYHFFIFSVDYSRTEYAEFEDDDYHYYVKAIPKIKVTDSERQVMNITSKSEDGSDDAGTEAQEDLKDKP